MSLIDLGLSAIRASQVALRTTGHNVANVGTAGYHRQSVTLVSREAVSPVGHSMGAGVAVAGVERLAQAGLESSLLSHRSQSAAAEARRGVWERLEIALAPESESLVTASGRLFAAIERLAGQPREPALRTAVIHAADRLAATWSDSLAALDSIASEIAQEIRLQTADFNRVAGELVRIESRLREALAAGTSPNDLLDARQRLLGDLADIVDVRAAATSPGDVPAVAVDGTLLIAAEAFALTTGRDAAGNTTLLSKASQLTVRPASGRLAGLLNAADELQRLRRECTEWFDSLRTHFDEWQATGLGLENGWTHTSSTRRLTDADGLLVTQPLNPPLTAGHLHLTVTTLATGQRKTHAIAVDPAIDSLADIISRLDALPGVNAAWDATTGQMRLFASDGHRLDFAGRLDQSPADSTISGTSRVSIGGRYTGRQNAVWQATVVASGEVGAAPAPRLEIRDRDSGALLRAFDIGSDASPGTDLDIGQGVTLRLTPGTLLTGDQWQIPVIAEPDDTGLLAALGLRPFFVTTERGRVTVNPDLLATPDSLAASPTGHPADAARLQRLLEWRDAPLSGTSTTRAGDWLAQWTSALGTEVESARSEVEVLGSLQAELESQRDALSGVDVNEEMLLLLQYQQMFQSAARLVTTVNETLNELLRLVG